MNVPKSLLSAILIGISVQTTTSCVEDGELPEPNTEQNVGTEGENPHPIPGNCPACGMG